MPLLITQITRERPGRLQYDVEVMRGLCGIDEPRVLQESRRMFMNASEPMGILWGFIQSLAAISIEIHRYLGTLLERQEKTEEKR